MAGLGGEDLGLILRGDFKVRLGDTLKIFKRVEPATSL